MDDNLVKVSINIDSPITRVEKIWCLRTHETNKFIVACCPVYADIQPMDVICVEDNEYGEKAFKEIVTKSEYKKYCVLGIESAAVKLTQLGHRLENLSSILGVNTYYTAVSKDADKEALLKDILRAGMFCPMLAKEVYEQVDKEIPNIQLERHIRGAKKLKQPEKVMEKYYW